MGIFIPQIFYLFNRVGRAIAFGMINLKNLSVIACTTCLRARACVTVQASTAGTHAPALHHTQDGVPLVQVCRQ